MSRPSLPESSGHVAVDKSKNLPLRRNKSEAPSHRHGTESVVVVVGEGTTRSFVAHKDLLVSHSEFFRGALKSEWQEGTKQACTLPKDDQESFELFYNFIYTGQVFSIQDGDIIAVKAGRKFSADVEWGRLFRSWVLGEKLLSITFKDAVIDAIIAKMQASDRCPVDGHGTVYPKSSAQSLIRKLLVDVAVWKWADGSLEAKVQDTRADWTQFFKDVLLALNKTRTKGRQGSSPWEGANKCVYHEHGKDVPCYKTMF